MTKFKVGQTVRCIGEHGNGAEGAGWEKGLIFKIKDISASLNSSCYWPAKNRCGVYETYLELVNNDWDE